MKRIEMERIPEIKIQDTRYKILQLLKLEGSKTVNELREALGISSMGVRQHLLYLEHEGFVNHNLGRMGVGRPSYVFSLSDLGDELFPRRYGQLAVNMLDAISDDEGVDEILEKITEKLEVQYKEHLSGKSLEEQVTELTNIRIGEGYMAELERRDEDTFILTEHNCAIYQVALSCGKLCVYEQELFRRVLDWVDVSRESHIISGDKKCTFIIQRRK
jgi:predicted ArsR family transcriptional regulator